MFPVINFINKRVFTECFIFSRELLQGITSCDLHNSLFPYMTSKLTKVAGHTVRALRTSFAGELGWQLHIPFNACEDVYNVVKQEGLKYGLRHAGYRALYSLSCEKGIKHQQKNISFK